MLHGPLPAILCGLCLISLGHQCESLRTPKQRISMQNVGKKPNFVFVLTDDQDSVLGGMTPMAKTKKLIGDEGITFVNSFVSSPLCCPSRSSILTGKYVHNHGALNNSVNGGCSNAEWRKTHELTAFPVTLKGLGYNTFFAGKYLNHYGLPGNGGVEHIPPGWDDWNGNVGQGGFYNYNMSVNGTNERHESSYEEDYLTDLIGRRAERFLGFQNEDRPFFMMLSTTACHTPVIPGPQYENHYSNYSAPRTKSYDIHGENKHWLLSVAKPMFNSTKERIDELFRNRWRTLLSVDDVVENMVSLLQEKNLLDNTYIIFTSDNGYHLGQFSMAQGKGQMYEFDIRVPFMIRGPNITRGQTRKESVVNIDLAPTFIHLAGGVPNNMDGESLHPILFPDKKSHFDNSWRSTVMIEHKGQYKTKSHCSEYEGMLVSACSEECTCRDGVNNTFSCLRIVSKNANFVYCQFSDDQNFVEAYDLNSDPDQLTNVASCLHQSVKSKLKEKLKYMKSCAGESCHNISIDQDTENKLNAPCGNT